MNSIGNYCDNSVYEDCISHISDRNITDNIIDKDISVYELCNENRDRDNSFNISNNNINTSNISNKKNNGKNTLFILESKRLIFNDNKVNSRTKTIKYNSNISNPFQNKNRTNKENKDNKDLFSNKLLLKNIKEIKTGNLI